MKLASYADGSRDGQLVVVSRDLASAHYATGLATRLQQVLDDWNFLSPQLETLSQALNHGKARHAFAFEPARCLSPLPRAFQWVVPEGERLRHAAGDGFLASSTDVDCEGAEIDVQTRLAVMVGDVQRGVAPESAAEAMRLVLLAAEVAGLGTAFAPLAVTPDELDADWRADQLHVFGEQIARAAQRRAVAAGSLVGGADLGPPRSLAAGATVRAELKNAAGRSLFGAVVLRGAVPATEPQPEDTPS